MRNLFALALLALVGWAAPASAQITISTTFVNGTAADADAVNAVVSTLATQALNRTGGVLTGNITASSGVTIDGVDVGAALGGTGTPTFAGITVSGTGASALDVAGGINAGSGNVGIVDTTGKIPALSTTYFASVSGANLTGLNATQLTSGTVPLARLSGITTSQLSTPNISQFTNDSGYLVLGSYLDAGNLTSGTLPDGRLSGNYSGLLGFTGGVTISTQPLIMLSQPQFGTGASGSAAVQFLNSNCPAVDCGHIYVWLKVTGPDGSTIYLPAWK